MQACTAEKQNKGSTVMNKNLLILLVLPLFYNCGKNNINPEPIPDVPVNVTVNMSLPSNSHLLNSGSFIYEQGGVKGIVIVHSILDDDYYAFDRCCSYKPNETCSKLEMDSTLLVLRCGESKIGGFEKCCDSKFNLEGQVYAGPASFGLKQYQVIRSGNLLNIKN